ncbi:hypothetical protein BHE74_00059404 [Ensete ventricosum]|nr:hypothetical protein BHE74_00059404 [Ensete ventricosum]
MDGRSLFPEPPLVPVGDHHPCGCYRLCSQLPLVHTSPLRASGHAVGWHLCNHHFCVRVPPLCPGMFMVQPSPTRDRRRSVDACYYAVVLSPRCGLLLARGCRCAVVLSQSTSYSRAVVVMQQCYLGRCDVSYVRRHKSQDQKHNEKANGEKKQHGRRRWQWRQYEWKYQQ